MKKMLFVIVWAAAQAVSAAGAASAGAVHIVTRVYDAAPVPTSEWTDALAVAGAILEQAGVTVEWQRCGSNREGAPGRACLTPLGANEFALRLVAGHIPEGHAGYLPLGYSPSTPGRGPDRSRPFIRIAWPGSPPGPASTAACFWDERSRTRSVTCCSAPPITGAWA